MTVEIKGIGKITASKDALNTISIAFDEAAQWNKENGYDAFEERFANASQTIYEALLKAGFYKENK
jgi:hypothetical protein